MLVRFRGDGDKLHMRGLAGPILPRFRKLKGIHSSRGAVTQKAPPCNHILSVRPSRG
jgi:hypothetical protein